MLGVVLIWLGTFFEEISAVAGKKNLLEKKEDVYVFGFLQILAVLTAFLLMLALLPGALVFSWESLPTLSVRIIFEIIQCYCAIMALQLADRSTMGILRSGTIPLLLLVDIMMGYSISSLQLTVVLALFVLIVLAVKERVVRREGLKYVTAATLLPVITASLYKYNIDNFNSVAVEGTIVYFALLLFWGAMNAKRYNNPFKYLKNPQIVLQSVSLAIEAVLMSVAFLYSFPSLLIAVKRASSIFWSTLSGIYIFREEKGLAKICLAGVMLSAIFILV